MTGETNNQKHLADVCLHRATTSFQAAYLLIQRGLASDARGALRAILETLFILVGSRNNEAKIWEYLNYDEEKTLKALKKMRQRYDPSDPEETLRPEDVKNLDARIAAMDAARRDPNWIDVKRVPISDLAKAAGMERVYDEVYSYFCRYVHFAPSGVQDSYEIDAVRKKVIYKIEPDYLDVDLLMKFAIHAMIVIASHVLNINGAKSAPELDALNARFKALV